jgi:predicted DNA-binding helix-hairpin-helix protein
LAPPRKRLADFENGRAVLRPDEPETGVLFRLCAGEQRQPFTGHWHTGAYGRENRLYQADWLLRFYGFGVDEIVTPETRFLDMQIDPKLAWALAQPAPVSGRYQQSRPGCDQAIPGIGIQSAQKIWEARKFSKLTWDHLKKFNIAANRAKVFSEHESAGFQAKGLRPDQIRNFILSASQTKYAANHSPQLQLF